MEIIVITTIINTMEIAIKRVRKLISSQSCLKSHEI
jgi:hypothetical protein